MSQIVTERIEESMMDSVDKDYVRNALLDGTSNSILADTGWSWVCEGKDSLPPYWSKKRDVALRNFWKLPGSGHLASAISNAQSKLLSIPCSIVPRDTSIVSHARDANERNKLLYYVSEMGQGLSMAMEKFIEDYLTQDNGGFLEIIGPDGIKDKIKGVSAYGKAGPIDGRPYAVRHLDSERCFRTGDPVYPVIYRTLDGKNYKFHFSRIIYRSQMPSANSRLNGVGYCAVSRAIDAAQSLRDIMIYKQEKLGSRPHSKLFLGKGIKGQEIMKAFRLADIALDALGEKRYGRNIAIGSENTDVDIKDIDLTSMDSFDESVSVPFAMFAIALAFGLDPQELWPGSSGGTSASAALSHMRARGRLPTQLTHALEVEFAAKFLPKHLMLKFDLQDDAEDQQRSINRDIRGRNRTRNISSGVTTPYIERRIMLNDGDMTREEFEEIELRDGRLPDGAPVDSLFYSEDEFYTGIDGLLTEANGILYSDADRYMSIYPSLKEKCLKKIGTETSLSSRRKSKMALYAIEYVYQKIKASLEQQETPKNLDGDSPISRTRQGRGDRNSKRR